MPALWSRSIHTKKMKPMIQMKAAKTNFPRASNTTIKPIKKPPKYSIFVRSEAKTSAPEMNAHRKDMISLYMAFCQMKPDVR